MLLTLRILSLCLLFFAGYVSASCGQKESPFSCFIGSSLNSVHLGPDGLYHTDYYCSDMVSSYYSPDNKGDYSGEWHYNGPSDTKDCKYYRELDRLSIQNQIDNCMYWKKNNMQVPEKYHCNKFLKDY